MFTQSNFITKKIKQQKKKEIKSFPQLIIDEDVSFTNRLIMANNKK